MFAFTLLLVASVLPAVGRKSDANQEIGYSASLLSEVGSQVTDFEASNCNDTEADELDAPDLLQSEADRSDMQDYAHDDPDGLGSYNFAASKTSPVVGVSRSLRAVTFARPVRHVGPFMVDQWLDRPTWTLRPCLSFAQPTGPTSINFQA